MTHTAPARLLVLLPLLGSCASFPRRDRPPLAPPPGATWLRSDDGTRLYVELDAPAGTPRGVVFLVLGPQIATAPAYPGFRARLREAGFVLAAVHPRGAGYSEGVRGDVARYERVLEDYSRFLAHLRARFPGVPLVLMGHSAGGALALELAARSPTGIAGLILVNPAYRLITREGMGPSCGEYIAYAANYLFRPSALTVDLNARPQAIRDSDDRAEAEAMQRDRLVVRYFSLRYLLAQKRIMDRCASNLRRLATPLLIVQGRRDALVDPRGNTELLAASPAADKRRLVAPGGHGSSAVESVAPGLVAWLSARALSAEGRARSPGTRYHPACSRSPSSAPAPPSPRRAAARPRTSSSTVSSTCSSTAARGRRMGSRARGSRSTA